MQEISLNDGEMMDFLDHCLHHGMTEVTYLNGGEEVTFLGTMDYQQYNFVEVPPKPPVPNTSVLSFDVDQDDWRVIPKGKVLSVDFKESLVYNMTEEQVLTLFHEENNE